MMLGHAIRHPQAIVAIADIATNVDGKYNAEAEKTTIEVGIQPKDDTEKQPRAGMATEKTLVEAEKQPRAEEYSSAREPPPLPDRPDVEGSLWKESVVLAHLTPQERENFTGIFSTVPRRRESTRAGVRGNSPYVASRGYCTRQRRMGEFNCNGPKARWLHTVLRLLPSFNSTCTVLDTRKRKQTRTFGSESPMAKRLKRNTRGSKF
jgi:hypothetical protein